MPDSRSAVDVPDSRSAVDVPGSAPRVESGPAVTVAVTRRAAAERDPEVLAWVEAGQRLAETFPGFLGTGWVRPSAESRDWHMLYRFADEQALARWEASSQRAWWLSTAAGLVESAVAERRTGIEGWFDGPGTTSPVATTGRAPVATTGRAPAATTGRAPAAADQEPAPVRPPRWKQASVIWLGFFPTSLLVNALLGPLTGGRHLVLRVLASTLCATPLMTYLVLPRVTSWLQWWLQGRRAPWRDNRSRAAADGRAPEPR